MRKRTAFTLIELLVVIAIIALLLAILMPALKVARNQTKDVVCLLTLKQWCLVFQLYATDNNGTTISDPPWREEVGGGPGVPGPESWIGTLYEYYKDKTLLLCPMAKRPWYESGEWGKKDMAWYIEKGRTELPPDFDLEGVPFPGVVGSYGINDWCYNGPPDAEDTWGFLVDLCWRDFEVDGSYNIPIFSDCLHIGAFAQDHDDPPGLEDAPWTGSSVGMARYCMDRHGTGTINVLFMDFSARAVGLKELWTLQWHREYDINGPWTIAGFGGDVADCAAAWDEAAPWMRRFLEY